MDRARAARGTPGPAPRNEALSLLAPSAPAVPLAERLRPRTLDEFVGQEAVIGPGTVLRRAAAEGRLPSLILWGPPGSGKTTLARLLAAAVDATFLPLSAVSAGVADLRRAVDVAERRRGLGAATVLFVDELHRWNRAQQDAVLPYVERGLLTLIGATTENPSHAVNAALVSRCRVFGLERLSDDQVAGLLRRALSDPQRGLTVPADPEAVEALARAAAGDARVALTALELAAAGGRLTLATALDALQRPALLFDRNGDQHYDVVSALIKSVRGSDADAAVYWLARLLEAGEDVRFVARRLVILAAEDVGLADPGALPLAVAAHHAAHLVGLPEAVLPLAEAALYLARAPKSNSVLRAYDAARQAVEAHGALPVPLHLRNATTGLDRAAGYGRGYLYPHDFPGHAVPQAYLPPEVGGPGALFEPGELDRPPVPPWSGDGAAPLAEDPGRGAGPGDRRRASGATGAGGVDSPPGAATRGR